MPMKIKVKSQQHNPLLKRTEVAFEIDPAETGGTPPRLEVRKMLAEALKADIERVYIKKMETKTGAITAFGEANVYESIEQAKLVEPEHIITRNSPKEEKPKAEE
jgi:ribosomal protein S24E